MCNIFVFTTVWVPKGTDYPSLTHLKASLSTQLSSVKLFNWTILFVQVYMHMAYR